MSLIKVYLLQPDSDGPILWLYIPQQVAQLVREQYHELDHMAADKCIMR